jgi:hypothetical protein
MRRTFIPAAIVTIFWSLQHVALPSVPDAGYVIYRTISVVPIAITAIGHH